MKQILIAIAAITTLVACQEPTKCYQCSVTEYNSHGVALPTTSYYDVCGDESVRVKFVNDNTRSWKDTLVDGNGDTTFITHSRTAYCGGVTYSN